jgi:acyl carrier protein
MIINNIKELRDLISKKNISFEKFFFNKIGVEWDYDAKCFGDLGVDNLDIIELIMWLEKEMDCYIPDELGEVILKMNPNDLIQSYIRNIKLKELGI